MAMAVRQDAGYRSGSRSPRGKGITPDTPEAPSFNGPDGLFDKSGGFTQQMRLQRDFLAQFMQPANTLNFNGPPTALPEAAAGLPLEAANVLLLQSGPGPARPWRGRPAWLACLAAAQRLFARLLPKQMPETACDELCQRGDLTLQEVSTEQVIEMAQRCGLAASSVTSPVEVLDEMLKHRLSACCVLLNSYVGVLEESGEEVEQEVGPHCLLIVGGDLLGPTYVTFDPFGPSAGEVSLWPDHAVKSAGPVGFVQLTLPEAPK